MSARARQYVGIQKRQYSQVPEGPPSEIKCLNLKLNPWHWNLQKSCVTVKQLATEQTDDCNKPCEEHSTKETLNKQRMWGYLISSDEQPVTEFVVGENKRRRKKPSQKDKM